MGTRSGPQLAHQVLDVRPDGVRANAQHETDLLGRVAARQLGQHEALLARQALAAASPRALRGSADAVQRADPLAGHKTRHRLALKTEYVQSVFFERS